MPKKLRKPTRVKDWMDPDLARQWERSKKKYPYLFWVQAMTVRNDEEWYDLIEGKGPDLTHEAKIPMNPKEIVEIAKARREIYFQIARAFARPTKELVEDIVNGKFSDTLRGSLAVLFNDSRVEEGLDKIAEFIEKFRTTSIENLYGNFDNEYLTLLYDGWLPWISCYESIYRSEKQIMGDTTMEVKHGYNDAGYVISLKHGNDPPDDVKLELEFMFRLCDDGIEEWKKGNSAEEYLKMQQEHLKNHMIEWIPYLCDDLYKEEFKVDLGKKFHYDEEIARRYEEEVVEADFYRGMAKITKAMLEHDYNQIDAMIKEARNFDIAEISKLCKNIRRIDTAKEQFSLEPKAVAEDYIPYVPKHPKTA